MLKALKSFGSADSQWTIFVQKKNVANISLQNWFSLWKFYCKYLKKKQIWKNIGYSQDIQCKKQIKFKRKMIWQKNFSRQVL